MGALVIDFIGCISYAVPMLGEAFDTAWAPISAMLVGQLFDSNAMAMLNLSEELLPMTDVVPTATIAWTQQHWEMLCALIVHLRAHAHQRFGDDGVAGMNAMCLLLV